MATKSSPRAARHRRATIQWLAIGLAIALGILASFVFFGEDSTTGGGHSGLSAVQGAVAAA